MLLCKIVINFVGVMLKNTDYYFRFFLLFFLPILGNMICISMYEIFILTSCVYFCILIVCFVLSRFVYDTFFNVMWLSLNYIIVLKKWIILYFVFYFHRSCCLCIKNIFLNCLLFLNNDMYDMKAYLWWIIYKFPNKFLAFFLVLFHYLHLYDCILRFRTRFPH